MEEKKPDISDLQSVVCMFHRLEEIADKLDPERKKTFDVAPIDSAIDNLKTFFLRHTGELPPSDYCPSKDKLKEYLEKKK